jgi:prolyl-tRNA synthetase
MEYALPTRRSDNFPQWYQCVVEQADLAEESGVRGCMIIKPWGYGIWERIRSQLDHEIGRLGHENCYFPLFLPLSMIKSETDHVEGFSKEMAVVTHHRLTVIDGTLGVDPGAQLDEPLIVRPTSEMMVGSAFSRWIHSYRDLPVLINQWANVVRWELRPRMFLRTSEFLWQEGHTAHGSHDDAMRETLSILEMYNSFAEGVLAMPVIAGEKPPHERFPGAVSTFSIESMMQDGKALQAGTSHYLGTNFARAQNIQFQSATGENCFAHTTSWGASTRLIGGVIMSHGDDDGLQLPPRIAPQQVLLVPILRGQPSDEEVLRFCDQLASELRQQSVFGEPLRVKVDQRDVKAVAKRWQWVRRGAPLVCEIGPRDVAADTVSFIRRDQLRSDDKLRFVTLPRAEFRATVRAALEDMQSALFSRASERMNRNIATGIGNMRELREFFGNSDDESARQVGWARVPWSRPDGDASADILAELKAMKVTVRNAPMRQDPIEQPCIFTGRPAVERILIARAY